MPDTLLSGLLSILPALDSNFTDSAVSDQILRLNWVSLRARPLGFPSSPWDIFLSTESQPTRTW